MNAIATQDCAHDRRFRNSSPSVFIKNELTLKARDLLYLSTCAKQPIKLRGKILKSLPQTIVTVNGLCLEAWHINASSCVLNRDDGSYLTQEYLHLIANDVM